MQASKITKDPVVKQRWAVEFNGRTFSVHKSSFGWHIDEVVAGKYVRHVFGLVHGSKNECIGCIEANA